MTSIVSKSTLKSVNDILSELNLLRRWSFVPTEGRFTELSKQGLNSAIAYFWAVEAQHLGVVIDFNLFPKLALYRSFQKTIQCDIHEGAIDAICAYGVPREAFDTLVEQKICSQISKVFHEFISVDPDSIESNIYKGATKVATLLELESLRWSMSEKDYLQTRKEVLSSLANYCSIPGYDAIFSDDYLGIFEGFSKLRNMIRWAKRPNILKCNVLGHLFDTAIFAYLLSLEASHATEDLATQFFFMGIFHDFPEAYTGDMPSPIKDAIPGLRQATEQYELEMLEKNVYCHLPDYQVATLKQVMLEDEANVSLKHSLKTADYFAASVECWRQILAGARDHYFFNVIDRDYTKKESFSPNFRSLMEALHEDAVKYYR